MYKFCDFVVILFVICASLLIDQRVYAQNKSIEREEYTGSAISFNGPRTATAFFNLRITGQTSDEQVPQYLSVLQNDGQDAALNAIRKQDLGTFSIGSQLGRTLNVVRESQVDGRRRIFIVFERWTRFAEARGGYRSLDYPFGVIEIFIDDKTGTGEGTYIPAARIRLDTDRKSNQQQLEIENFATYPVKLNNIKRETNRRRL
jgi:hypothetical protein